MIFITTVMALLFATLCFVLCTLHIASREVVTSQKGYIFDVGA